MLAVVIHHPFIFNANHLSIHSTILAIIYPSTHYTISSINTGYHLSPIHPLGVKHSTSAFDSNSRSSSSSHKLLALKDDVVDAATGSSTDGKSTLLVGVSSDKLVFDKQSNRFFEADTSSVLEEEFCLVDQETGRW